MSLLAVAATSAGAWTCYPGRRRRWSTMPDVEAPHHLRQGRALNLLAL